MTALLHSGLLDGRSWLVRSISEAAAAAGRMDEVRRLLNGVLAAPAEPASNVWTREQQRDRPVQLADIAVSVGLLASAESMLDLVPAERRADALARIAQRAGTLIRSAGVPPEVSAEAERLRSRWLIQGLTLELTPRLLAVQTQSESELAIPVYGRCSNCPPGCPL